MHRIATLGTMWCLSLVLSPSLQAGKLDTLPADSTEKLRAIVSILRILWDQDFQSNYQKYMLGPSSTVVLIPRTEMKKMAAARLDGRARNGDTTQGLTIRRESDVKVLVVYDDLAPLFVASTINHEIGHVQLMGKGLSRNNEEARVMKTVETAFFEKVFGRGWMQTTLAALGKSVRPVEKNGRLYQGHTPEAVEVFYQQLKKGGANIERTRLHDQIVEHLVFIFTNSERSLSAALDYDDEQD